MQTYIPDRFQGSSAFFLVEFAIAVLVEYFGDDVVTIPDYSIAVNVEGRIRQFLLGTLLNQLSPCLNVALSVHPPLRQLNAILVA